MEDISISNPRTLQMQQQVMKQLEILQTVSQPPTNASKIEGFTPSVKSILKNVVGLKLSGADFRVFDSLASFIHISLKGTRKIFLQAERSH